ncbi:HEAT repeat domain-containing protein [Ruania halotolerans]|uniref:HEAT repeat domain-containing protein n=1 Tax=Ruania halotolerans TaxID=2897773 RepID=UPI001E5355A1|nr:HEAT repeat domain-containing protein [Ruania halotolerans]UFU05963.1 HEAT repeat domain-containing protein [Ruania halotolerans]
MNSPHNQPSPAQVQLGLYAADSSTRLRAALAAGTYPDPELVETLITRSGIEPDFFVRDMLTWALTRHSAASTVPLLLAEISAPSSGRGQARSQALHTLSKIGAEHAWPAVQETLRDTDDEVARSAWRAAVAIAPAHAHPVLIETLLSQLGRGDRDVQRSLSRALLALADRSERIQSILDESLDAASTSPDPAVRAHAVATQRLQNDPDAAFELSVAQAQKVRALGAR